MVGMTGFEPATPWSRTRCSTRLSHIPTETAMLARTSSGRQYIDRPHHDENPAEKPLEQDVRERHGVPRRQPGAGQKSQDEEHHGGDADVSRLVELEEGEDPDR